MTVRRVMGTEIEYGISVPGQPGGNPMVTSSQIVNAYGARPELNRGGRARWDYEEESPLRDARGFTYSGALYDPSEALADEDLGLANGFLTPFFVTRQIVCGSGRVGMGQDGSQPGFQISQRADFFEVEVGLETTLKRPIINTRDEPHADADKYRRLHVIIGDANLSEISTYLKVGAASLVLAMIEEKALPGDLGIADPVSELKAVSHDPSLKHLIRMRDGRRLTALDVQWAFYERARAFAEARQGDDPTAEITFDVLDRWESILDRLGRDPMQCADELDWVAKLRLLEGYREREQLGWASHKLQLVDLQYSDVRPEKGLYHRLVARGSMKTLFGEDQVRRAMVEPPDDTRAYFRGRCLAQYASEVVAASWDSVIFDVGRESLVRVPMMEPERGTKKHVGALFDRCPSAKDLLEAITSG